MIAGMLSIVLAASSPGSALSKHASQADLLATIVKKGMEGDMYALGKLVNMPDLPHKVVWHGPSASWEAAMFDGVVSFSLTDPSGLSAIRFERHGSYKPLSVFTFRDNACPSIQEIGAALGGNVNHFPAPGVDGGPGHWIDSINYAPSGNIEASVISSFGCSFIVSRPSDSH